MARKPAPKAAPAPGKAGKGKPAAQASKGGMTEEMIRKLAAQM